MPPASINEHVHPLPVCGFGAHKPNAPQCAGLGDFVACGQIVDPLHPHFGMALCWHRKRPPVPPPAVPPVTPVPPPTAPPSTGVTTNPPSTTPPPTNGPSTTGQPSSSPSGSDGSSLPGTSTQPHDPAKPPDDGVVDPPPPTGWDWWWRYWWLFPFLLLLLILLGLLYKLLEALGLLKLLKDLIAGLWELIKEFLKGGTPKPAPPTVPETPHTPQQPEKPSDQHDDDRPRDQQGSCDVDGEPVLTLHPEGWIIVNPDCQPGNVHLAHPFSVDAKFKGKCSCCWYQQEIKGWIYVKRRLNDYYEDVGIELFGGRQLDPEVYQTDGTRWFPGYGFRNLPDLYPDDEYSPARADGCVYHAGDLPGVRGLSLGDKVIISLWWRGRVVDICTGKIKWEKEWHLKTRGTIDFQMTGLYSSIYTYKKLY